MVWLKIGYPENQVMNPYPIFHIEIAIWIPIFHIEIAIWMVYPISRHIQISY